MTLAPERHRGAQPEIAGRTASERRPSWSPVAGR